MVPQGGVGGAGGPVVTQGPGGWNQTHGAVVHLPRPAVSRECATLQTGGPGGCVPPRGAGVTTLSEWPRAVERKPEAREDRWGCSVMSPAGEGWGLGPAAQAGGYPWLGRCVHEAPSVCVYEANRQVRRLVPSTGAEQGQSEGVCPSGVHPVLGGSGRRHPLSDPW